MEKDASAQLRHWLFVKESALRQKSRIEWLKLGDGNTSYLNSAVKERNAKNRIDILFDSDGNKLDNPELIQREVLSLVLQLSSSNLKQIVLICRSWLRRSRPISSISLRLKESNFYPKKGRTTVSRGVRKSSTGNGLHLITKYRFNGHVVSESSNFFRSKEEWQELGSAFKAIHQIRKGRRSLFPQNKR
jgi:hypothetical protein